HIGSAFRLSMDLLTPVFEPHVDVRLRAVLHAAGEAPTPDDEVIAVPPHACDAAAPTCADQHFAAAHPRPCGSESAPDQRMSGEPSPVGGAADEPGLRVHGAI